MDIVLLVITNFSKKYASDKEKYVDLMKNLKFENHYLFLLRLTSAKFVALFAILHNLFDVLPTYI